MFGLRYAIVKPVVLIHCWGGMGSQFHAWHLLEILKLRHPRRNFALVFHTAGLTERFPEILDFLSVNEIRRIDDYDPKSRHGTGLKSYNSGLTKVVKSWAKQFLSVVGIENNHESLKNLTRVFPWTRAIRGHYSRIPINDKALTRISSKIFPSFEDQAQENLRNIVVHLRLGDLRDLADKSPIGEVSLRRVLNNLLEHDEFEQIIVHSDSPELVRTFLGYSSLENLVIRDSTVSPLSAMVEMVKADYFVGTSSKLSLWASIFRIKLGEENTYIPEHMYSALIELLGKEAKKIIFYD